VDALPRAKPVRKKTFRTGFQTAHSDLMGDKRMHEQRIDISL
jgi:hypothetical protein